MGVGGEGTIKKTKKSRAGGDASSKKSKGSKRAKSRSKSSKTRPTSRTKKASLTSMVASGSSGEAQMTDEEIFDRGESTAESDACTQVKPQKTNQTCITLWSEPTTYCVGLLDKATVTLPPCGDARCRNVCSKLQKEATCNEIEDREVQARLCIERLSNERDYYRAEFERLLKFFENIGASQEDEEGNALSCIACQKKEQMIEYLQRENEVLAKDKFCLMSRLEEGGPRFDSESPTGKCCKASCKRTERERDLLRLDIQRLEAETDCLREKIKTISESKNRDYAKFQEQRVEYENVINKLEGERRELMKAQGIRRVTINSLEEKVGMYTNLLNAAQGEVQRIQTQYCQLKKLHEQCDNALLDTQAQLMEVEAELMNCQNTSKYQKRNSRDSQLSAPKCPCMTTDGTTEPGRRVSYASEDIMNTLKQLNHDKDDLLNQLDTKTELLFQCQEETKNKDEIISTLEEEMRKLKDDMKNLEGRVIDLKDQCVKSAMIIENKETEIKNLQTDNEQKLQDVKKCQTILEEKEAQNKSLQAEVEQLNKETYALATSNHQLQTDSNHTRVQVSVVMETVNELENKSKQLEDLVVEYERQIRLLKNDLEDCQTKVNRKEIEINNLLRSKNNLQDINEQLEMNNRARDKTISDLKCECRKLETDLNGMSSKGKVSSELSSEMDKMRAERDFFEQENSRLRKRVNKLENKLFQCICTICDNVHDKCSMVNYLFKDHEDMTCRCRTRLGETRDIGIQTFGETIRNVNTSTNSIRQVMAAVPLRDDQSSRVITSLSNLPGTTDRSCLCKKDTIISSMYKHVEQMTPFTYKLSNESDNQHDRTSPLNVIVEESSTQIFEDDEKIEKIHDAKQSSQSFCPDVEERGKYIIDNVTSVCKIVQVDTEERIIRRKTLDDKTETPKTSSRTSFGYSKNF